MRQNNRLFSSYIRAALRIRGFYVQILGTGVALMAGMLILSYWIINDINSVLLQIADLEAASLAQHKLQTLVYIYLGTLGIGIASAVFILLFIGQRVGGPTVAIKAFINELRKGNYDYKRNLREGDELNEIMVDLRALAEDLKKKQSLS